MNNNKMKTLALIVGPLAALAMAVMMRLNGWDNIAAMAGALTLLCAIWWVFEPVPIPITSLIPLGVFPLVGILDGKQVAAVDFQYVGGGCGMKDVAYFIGSCLNEDQCQQQEASLLDYYFQQLRLSLLKREPHFPVDALELDWRALYPVAWTDFHRFIKGWSPGHWKINSYSERLAREVISQLNKKN